MQCRKMCPRALSLACTIFRHDLILLLVKVVVSSLVGGGF